METYVSGFKCMVLTSHCVYEGNMKRLALSKVDLWRPWRYWAEDAIDLALHCMSAHSMPKVILTSRARSWGGMCCTSYECHVLVGWWAECTQGGGWVAEDATISDLEGTTSWEVRKTSTKITTSHLPFPVLIAEKTFRLPVSLFMLLVTIGSSYLSIQHIRITPQSYPNISVILYGHAHLRWMMQRKSSQSRFEKPSEDLSFEVQDHWILYLPGPWELTNCSHILTMLSTTELIISPSDRSLLCLQSRVLCPDFLAESCLNLAPSSPGWIEQDRKAESVRVEEGSIYSPVAVEVLYPYANGSCNSILISVKHWEIKTVVIPRPFRCLYPHHPPTDALFPLRADDALHGWGSLERGVNKGR